MVEHLLERSRRVVVEVGRSLANAAQLGDVQGPEVVRMPCQEQSCRVGRRDELEGAVCSRDAVPASVARKPLRTRREAVRGRARAGGLDRVVAREGANTRECRIGRGRTGMQRAAVALSASAVEDYPALLLKLIQLGIRIGERP